ncbi:MAG: sigma-54 dependent transcriptional regulator [Deferribacterota bacterium]|nr:sigma-54 dependent transcriptional regulator [Deferribacterota bacterium]
MKSKKILIVDDNDNMRKALSIIVNNMNFEAETAIDGDDAFEKATKNYYDMIISDMKMPKVDGLTLLKMLNTAGIKTPIAFITAYGTIANAVESLKLGASDYILKPFSAEVIEQLINRTLSVNECKKNYKELEGPLFISPASVAEIFALASDLSKTDVTILITGASGTGKDILAEYIHKNSDRSNYPFIAINCAAIPDNLIESELFGYEKGAFTGAESTKKGKFELANNGTILLDEIGEMPFHLQAKLLRVIEEREVERLGSTKKIKLNVRIIATTNRDLRQEVKNGAFREDLFYRLNVINIELPSLKGRKKDILEFSKFFVNKFASHYNKKVKNLSADAENVLINYDWPGNIRELKHTIERAVILSKSEVITKDNLFLHGITFGHKEQVIERNDEDILVDKPISEVEKELILNTLSKYNGNRTKTANALGITVRTLRNKINEYRENGIDVDRYIEK